MPAQQAKYHFHPSNENARVYGRQLGNGDVIKREDVYNSSSGNWVPAPCPGVKLRGFDKDSTVVWVRPEEEHQATMEAAS